jgi:hypothetical protein
MALVVGRRVLGAFVIALCANSGLEGKYYRNAEGEDGGDEARWEDMGGKAFAGKEGEEKRREVVEGLLSGGGTAGWCDEQVSRGCSLPLAAGCSSTHDIRPPSCAGSRRTICNRRKTGSGQPER